MKTIKIYEPAMCCSTGICGPSVDTELLRITATMNQMNKNEQRIERFNLTDQPMVFVEDAVVNQLLNEKGIEVLPITVVDNEVVKIGQYPTNNEIEQYLSIRLEEEEFNVLCTCGGDC